MSLSESETEEFYDAEDASLNNAGLSTEPTSLESGDNNLDKEALQIKATEVEERARRIEERRQRLLREEDETFAAGTSGLPAHLDDGSSSYTESVASSSIEGLYLSRLKQQPTLTPSTQQTSSSSTSDSRRSSSHRQNEPDVVASTKPTGFGQDFPAPVAPPRRRRKSQSKCSRQSPNPSAYDSDDALSINSVQPLGLPPAPVETPTSSIGREFLLPVEQLQRGQYVVKPQDKEEDRGMSKEEVRQQFEQKSSDNGIGVKLPRRSSSASVKTLEYKTPESSLKPNSMPRLRSDSGRHLSDIEILEQIEVLNLDTGEKIPLGVAEDKLPQCVNPLSLHLMRITQEYVSPWFKGRKKKRFLRRKKETAAHDDDVLDDSSTLKLDGSDADHQSGIGEAALGEPSEDDGKGTLKKKASRLKKKIGKKFGETYSKIKTAADGKIQQWQQQHSTEEPSEVDLMNLDPQPDKIKVVTSSKSQKSDFDGIREVQALKGIHKGAIWTMKFSHCGRLLASAGQDHVLRIWVLRDSFEHFNELRKKSLNRDREDSILEMSGMTDMEQKENDEPKEEVDGTQEDKGPFMPTPFANFEGHTADILDVSWSKSYFILSSSMDKTVRLWHMSRAECLCVFHHVEFVTAIAFHPRDDRYFLSGSLDGKLRLWNIPDKKVHLWNELEGTHAKLITCANFCHNGKFAVVGSYDGRCVFYTTDQLKYYTQIAVRSSRGKNSQGKKISGIEPMPGEDKILVTSNDSRIRLYDLRDLSLSCKYRGLVNSSSQIKANFSPDGRYVISGSENALTYIWKTYYDHSAFSSARRDRNAFWENIKVHDASVTAAVFAPKADIIIKQLEDTLVPPAVASETAKNYVIVSADFKGDLRVMAHTMRSE